MCKAQDKNERESNCCTFCKPSFFAHEFNTYTLEKLLCKSTAVFLF